MNKEEFDALVAKDVRNQTSTDEAAFLRSSENMHDWYDALIALLRSVDLQFVTKKAETLEMRRQTARKTAEWEEYLERLTAWRINVTTFKTHIERRVAECRKLRRETPAAADTTRKLVQAIQQHIDEVHDLGPEESAETVDEKLWAVLEEDEVTTLVKHLKAS